MKPLKIIVPIVLAIAAIAALWVWNSGGIEAVQARGTSAFRLAPSTHKPLNDFVLEQLKEYKTNGKHKPMGYGAAGRRGGVTQDLMYCGHKVAGGDDERRAYPSGLVLEVYVKACERYTRSEDKLAQYRIPGVAPGQFDAFRQDFFPSDPANNPRALVDALVKRGGGKEIASIQDAKPGDFIQFWRNDPPKPEKPPKNARPPRPQQGALAAVFLGFDKTKDGKPGIRYWTVQASTDGIGEQVEALGTNPGELDSARVFVVRPWVPDLIVPN